MLNKIDNNKNNTYIKLLDNKQYKIYQINNNFFRINYNDDIMIFFEAEGRDGGLYSKISYILNKNKRYWSPRYHYKYITLIRDISIILLHNNYLWDYEANDTLLNVRKSKGWEPKNNNYIGCILEL